jgi:hypothetical protein
MTTRGEKFRALKLICDEVVCRIDRLRHPDPDNAEVLGERSSLRRWYFPQPAIARRLKQEQRALQDGINRAQQVVDQTLALLTRTGSNGSLRDAEQTRKLAATNAGRNGLFQDAA